MEKIREAKKAGRYVVHDASRAISELRFGSSGAIGWVPRRGCQWPARSAGRGLRQHVSTWPGDPPSRCLSLQRVPAPEGLTQVSRTRRMRAIQLADRLQLQPTGSLPYLLRFVTAAHPRTSLAVIRYL